MNTHAETALPSAAAANGLHGRGHNRAATETNGAASTPQPAPQKGRATEPAKDAAKRGFRVGLRAKTIIPSFMLLAATTGVLVGVVTFQRAKIADERYAALDATAVGIQDKIDRALFDRSGDAQAFALNAAFQRDLTSTKEPERKQISSVLDTYVKTYNTYLLTLLLDPSGKVVAANTIDPEGAPLSNPAAIAAADFSGNEEFKNARDGKFNTSATAGAQTGTVMGRPTRDPLVSAAYGSKAPSWTISFTAPVKTAKGDVVGFIRNYVSESPIENIVAETYPILSAQGMSTASITIVEPNGDIIMNVDPQELGHTKNERDANFVENLLKAGDPLIKHATTQGTPDHEHETFLDKHDSDKHKKTIIHSGAYARSQAVMGFPGSGFITSVRIDSGEFMQRLDHLRKTTLWVGLGGLLIGGVVMWWVSGGVVKGVLRIRTAISNLAAGDISSPVNVKSRDEVGEMAYAFNTAREGLHNVFGMDHLDWQSIAAQRQEVARLTSVVENSPVNIIVADTSLKIAYLNPAARRTLASLEHLLPVRASQLIGQSVDVLHSNPALMRKQVSDPANLPFQTQFKLGNETIDLQATAVHDSEGKYLGPMISWEVITKRLEAEDRERAMTDNLRKTLDSVSQNSQTLASAAEELTTTSQQMSTNSSETSAQANAVAAAAEQVSANVATVATSAEELTASVKEIAKNASEAARVATNAVTVTEKTNVTVGKLGESSNEIGKVIKTITSIAEQTNLLALNATIEAARAGEMGKGFAVVANEVKELAKQTALATEDISQKIDAIQTDTRGAVVAIGQISDVIKQINDIQNSIASAVEEQSATTNEIARNATEAARGSTEISKSIMNVSSAARSTSEGAGNSLQAANELARLAANLKTLVEQSGVK